MSANYNDRPNYRLTEFSLARRFNFIKSYIKKNSEFSGNEIDQIQGLAQLTYDEGTNYNVFVKIGDLKDHKYIRPIEAAVWGRFDLDQLKLKLTEIAIWAIEILRKLNN